jgi:aryl-alcohol dehydrogenase-like predicted oxidoreductase
MRKRTLGRTGLEISVVGFGAWAIGGGGWEWGWGPQDDADSVAAIGRALDMGVNWIDTAPIYGFGRSEEVVGRTVKQMSEKPYIFSKCGLEGRNGIGVNELKAETIERQCEESLKRLGVETIDLYQIHWPDPDEDLEEGWAACVALLSAGKVRHIGVSNFNISQLDRANVVATVETLQPPYSLINRGIEKEILPYCAREDIGVIVSSPRGWPRCPRTTFARTCRTSRSLSSRTTWPRSSGCARSARSTTLRRARWRWPGRYATRS